MVSCRDNLNFVTNEQVCFIVTGDIKSP